MAAGVRFWQMLSVRRPRLRMQFLLTQVLIWAVLGNLVATAFSSAGPCYYGRVVGLPDPFAPLMEYLRRADEISSVTALFVQEKLWEAYLDPNTGVWYGIAAMPSLHVAIPFCYTLLSF